MKKISKKIVLASGSPRRKFLLKEAGFSFVIKVPSVDETPLRGEAPEKMVKRIAEKKADRVVSLNRSQSKKIFIAADTIVVSPTGSKILGKPRSKAEAFRMLSMLNGKTHTVITAYCLVEVLASGKKVKRVRAVRTRVKMRKLSKTDIRDYISTGEPMDKAGSYAAQGKGMVLIEKIQGSYTNVVGLPLSELVDDLRDHYGIEI